LRVAKTYTAGCSLRGRAQLLYPELSATPGYVVQPVAELQEQDTRREPRPTISSHERIRPRVYSAATISSRGYIRPRHSIARPRRTPGAPYSLKHGGRDRRSSTAGRIIYAELRERGYMVSSTAHYARPRVYLVLLDYSPALRGAPLSAPGLSPGEPQR
jgi:hypothetical protein